MKTTTRTVANSPSLTATLSNPLLPNDSFTSVIAEEPDSDCSDGNKRQSGRCLEDWLKSEYLANFGAQFNLTNLPIALLFLSEKDKWYTDDMWNGNASSTLKSAVFVGAILGMVSLGYVGDIVGRNNAFAITFLNSRGVDPDGRNFQGQTPMHIACMHASEKAIYYLLSYTMDINGQDN